MSDASSSKHAHDKINVEEVSDGRTQGITCTMQNKACRIGKHVLDKLKYENKVTFFNEIEGLGLYEAASCICDNIYSYTDCKFSCYKV